MSLISDIANWVCTDYLNRQDLLSVAQAAAVSVYQTICAKIPFDQLMVTGNELPVVNGASSYDLTSGTTQLFPALRAIASIRFSFSSTNRRRLRRSHVRVYDSLSFTTPGQVSTYARWANAVELNPPPNSNNYTLRVRYWSRPIMNGTNLITNASWSGGVVTLTIAGTNNVGATDQVIVSGVLPVGYNGTYTLTGSTGQNLTYALTANPGVYIAGGIATDTAVSALISTQLITPPEWDELFKWETLYKVYHYIDQQDKAMMLVQPQAMPRQATPKKLQMFEVGIIPRLWNDLLTTVSQQENTDEDFSINPVIRAYSYRK